MLHEIIKLNQHYPIDGDAELEIIIPYVNDINKQNKSRGILICPGGAYVFVSLREGDPVALEYARKGFVTFILRYTTLKPYPTPMHELACAVDYLRNNADKYFLDKKQLTILGFSAGGHLISSYGYLYKHPNFLEKTKLNPENIKPNALIAAYPVITTGEYTHQESKRYITANDDKLIELLSVENNIDSTYPPTFVWTTKEDTCVHYLNSVMYADALKNANVEHEFVLFEHLDHGKSIGTSLVNDIKEHEVSHYEELATWVKKSIDFLNKIYKK